MSRAVENHYATLGCEPSASFDVVRNQYRKLALQTHPDKQATSATTATASMLAQTPGDVSFERVHAAWLVLGDEQRRREYDQWLRATNGSSTSRSTLGHE